LAVEHRKPPFTIAYVDLDRGPRVLSLVKGEHSLSPETRVRLVGELEGDLLVEEVPDG